MGREVPRAAQGPDQDSDRRGRQALVGDLLLLPFSGPCNVGDRPKGEYNYFLNIRLIKSRDEIHCSKSGKRHRFLRVQVRPWEEWRIAASQLDSRSTVCVVLMLGPRSLGLAEWETPGRARRKERTAGARGAGGEFAGRAGRREPGLRWREGFWERSRGSGMGFPEASRAGAAWL